MPLMEDGVSLMENGVQLMEDRVLLMENGVLLMEDGVLPGPTRTLRALPGKAGEGGAPCCQLPGPRGGLLTRFCTGPGHTAGCLRRTPRRAGPLCPLPRRAARPHEAPATVMGPGSRPDLGPPGSPPQLMDLLPSPLI